MDLRLGDFEALRDLRLAPGFFLHLPDFLTPYLHCLPLLRRRDLEALRDLRRRDLDALREALRDLRRRDFETLRDFFIRQRPVSRERTLPLAHGDLRRDLEALLDLRRRDFETLREVLRFTGLLRRDLLGFLDLG